MCVALSCNVLLVSTRSTETKGNWHQPKGARRSSHALGKSSSFVIYHPPHPYQIEDLEVPYSTYSSKFCCGFDEWDPVVNNSRLHPIVAEFSLKFPPPTSLITSPDTPVWTLDALFLLPKLRLRYYKRLYTRLLKNAQPGRPDYNLLVGALDKLDSLLETIESRGKIKVGPVESPKSDAPVLGEDEVVVDLRTQRESTGEALPPNRSSDIDVTHSESSSARGSSVMG